MKNRRDGEEGINDAVKAKEEHESGKETEDHQGVRYVRDTLSRKKTNSHEAIRAALYPDESMIQEKYLYFCAKEPESGELYFSKTLDQHRRAVEIYAPYWQKYDEDRGIR